MPNQQSSLSTKEHVFDASKTEKEDSGFKMENCCSYTMKRLFSSCFVTKEAEKFRNAIAYLPRQEEENSGDYFAEVANKEPDQVSYKSINIIGTIPQSVVQETSLEDHYQSDRRSGKTSSLTTIET